VELLLAQTKQELKSVNSQLSDQRRCVEEFKLISETAEKRMLESSKAMADYRQGCGSGFNRVSGSGSGSRRAKMTHKSINFFVKSSCFEVLDGLF
jgi:hypothetical protein